jgi:integrase
MDSEPYYLASRKSWYIKIEGANGKRSQRKIGDTKKEAKKYLEALRKEQNRATSAGGMMLVDLVDQWVGWQLVRVDRGEVTSSWLSRRMSMVTRMLVDFKELHCGELKPFMLLDWTAKQGWKANTERMLLGVVNQVYKWGIKHKRISENPIDGIDMPSATRSEGCVTDDQHRQIMVKCGLDKRTRPLRPFLILLRNSGCRPGELQQLIASQVSGDCSTITLTKHKSSKKTGAKTVYLSPCGQTVLSILRSVRSDVLLLNGKGQPWTRNAIRIRFRRLRESLGLPADIVAYSYRHAFATRAIVAGVDIATVAELLGHSSTDMIAKHYGHLAQEKKHLKDAAAKAISKRENQKHEG